MARLTFREAVEEIVSEMDGPAALADIAREAARRCGRKYTEYTKRTVAAALAALPQVVRTGAGMYAPARLALDGKAFRVPLTVGELRSGQLSKGRLEPFYTALGKPPVVTGKGRPLPTVQLSGRQLAQIRDDAVRTAVEQLRALSWVETILAEISAEDILGQVWDRRAKSALDSGLLDLTPLGLGPADEGWSEERAGVDLILRWDARAGRLVAEAEDSGVAAGHGGAAADASGAESAGHGSGAGSATHGSDAGSAAHAMFTEDRILADFVASKLPRDDEISLGPLVLEAYARFPELGRMPGSAILDVIERDPRIRLTGGDPYQLGEVTVARADRLTWQERHFGPARDVDAAWSARWQEEVRARIRAHPERVQEAWRREQRRLGLDPSRLAGGRPSKVVLLRKPSHQDLIREWDAALREEGLSEKVRQRKIRHVETFAHYLENDDGRPGARHLLDVDEADLDSFFFWAYVRRYDPSRTDAPAFTRDLRDFYRFQQRMGRIMDARFAELIHGVRDLIVERIELYEGLMSMSDDADFEDLYETLFLV